MKNGGMGNPYEQPYSEQFKDSRTLPADNRLYSPRQRAKVPPHMQWVWCLLEEMKLQFGLLLEDFVRKNPVFVKRPAYVEPPYFSEPKVKIIESTRPNSATTFTDVFSIPVPARTELILGSVGMDYDLPLAVTNRDVLWRFRYGNSTLTMFDDNSSDIAGVFEEGVFSMPLGTFANPLPIYTLGVAPRLRAGQDTNIVLQARNRGATDVKTRVIATWYTYRMDQVYDSEQGEMIR